MTNKHCEHDRRRSQCKDCGGGSICEHDRIRCQCKDCGGGSICEHDRRRSECKDCGGGSICEHDRIRSRCKDCGGGSICEHDRRRSECKDCSPVECPKCLDIYSKGSLKCHLEIHTEQYEARKKKKEHNFKLWLDKQDIDYTREHNISFKCMSSTFCRIDFLIIFNGIIFFVELDEYQHVHYEISCDVKRMNNVYESLLIEGNTLPIVFIRLNPDKFTINGEIQKVGIKTRYRMTLDFIKAYKTSDPFQVKYFFYNETNSIIDICRDEDYDQEFRHSVI